MKLFVLGDKSNILQGPDARVIHQENLEKLASMTSSEIEEERTKLLANMDPSIVQFLKSRKCKPQHMSALAPNQSCRTIGKRESNSLGRR